MQVETIEINGFEIDEFNVHGLAEGKTQGTCPQCSHTRKPANQKAKCASYDWARGLVTCHNCHSTTQMHTFKRKGNPLKTYTKPEVDETQSPISDAVIDWFKTRGISRKTLTDLRVTEGSEWMPQTQKNENTIQFNYYIGNELVNVKYRDGRKNFKLFKGAEKVF